MHELSIAKSLVEVIERSILSEGGQLSSEHLRVGRVHIRVGELASVHIPSLEFSYAMITRGTRLEQSRLVAEIVPVTVFCPACQEEVAVPSIQELCCSRCGTVSGDLRAGTELEVESLEILGQSAPAGHSLDNGEHV